MSIRICFLTLILCGSAYTTAVAQKPTARVYILAGQSNMEGKGSVVTIERQLKDAEKSKLFQPLIDGDNFKVRDDVYISYLGNHGKRSGLLEIGYGTAKQNDKRMFGPELGFGWTVGDRFEEPVVLIKAAWGGKSIDRDFRPPSRGLPESIDQYFTKQNKRDENYTRQQCEEEYGHFYRLMIEHVQSVLADENLNTKYGDMKLSGFVWFQGFNDQFAPTSVEDYKDNLVAFIHDVRKELQTPNLQFVIGAMGHGGAEQAGKVKRIADAQVAVASHFNDGTVNSIRTAQFWDYDADAAFKQFWADEKNRDIEKWQSFGNDRPYHYHGSPRFFWNVGNAFGEAILDHPTPNTTK